MAGPKLDRPYESDKLGLVIQVRLGEAELAAYGAPAGPIDSQLHAFNGASRRRFGVHARGFILKREVVANDTNVPGGKLTKTYYSFVPVGTLATWGAAAIGSTIALGGLDYELHVKQEETVR